MFRSEVSCLDYKQLCACNGSELATFFQFCNFTAVQCQSYSVGGSNDALKVVIRFINEGRVLHCMLLAGALRKKILHDHKQYLREDFLFELVWSPVI